MIVKRKAMANNKSLKKYDSSKPLSYLKYYDANSLYPWAMTQPLPTGGFRWLDSHEELGEGEEQARQQKGWSKVIIGLLILIGALAILIGIIENRSVNTDS